MVELTIPDNLIEAYQEIKEEYPDADIDLSIDVAPSDYHVFREIRAKMDFDSVEEWHEKEDEIEKITEKYEEDDEVIYTIVDRRRDDDG